MKILSIIRQLFKSPAKEQSNEPVTINQLKNWIAESEQSNNLSGDKIKENLLEKLRKLLPLIEEKNQILKKLDISSYKVEDQIKLIVNENLPRYSAQLDHLLLSLRSTSSDNHDIDTLANAITIALSDFEKRSFKFYQKATILIGKEIGDTKEVITGFAQDLDATLKENAVYFSKKKSLAEIKKVLENHQELEATNQEIARNIERLNERMSYIKKEKEEKEKELIAYKNSIPYKGLLKSREETKQKLGEINKELLDIKQAINIKFLLKLFHHDKKKAKLIKNYEEVATALEADSELKIIEIIKDALNQGAPGELSSITRERLENIRNLKNTLIIKEDTRTAIYEEVIKKKWQEIISVNNENEKEMKRLEKIKEKQASIIKDLKNKLITFKLDLAS